MNEWYGGYHCIPTQRYQCRHLYIQIFACVHIIYRLLWQLNAEHSHIYWRLGLLILPSNLIMGIHQNHTKIVTNDKISGNKFKQNIKSFKFTAISLLIPIFSFIVCQDLIKKRKINEPQAANLFFTQTQL